MQATNYMRQARVFADDMYKLLLKNPNERIKRMVGELKSALNRNADAEKFVLPHNGGIMNDQLKGLIGTFDLRLPFPKIALEFPSTNGEGGANKRIIFANEEVIDGKETLIVEMACSLPMPPVSGIKEMWAMEGGLFVGRRSVTVDERGVATFEEGTFSNVDAFDLLSEESGDPSQMSAALRIILELVEALSCSNVTTEHLPHKHSREKHAALGFDEYRTLVVKVGGKVGGKHTTQGNGSVGHYTQRREHLRRGHIRRHPTAGNIWINSMVVNAGVGAKIHKTYKMEAA